LMVMIRTLGAEQTREVFAEVEDVPVLAAIGLTPLEKNERVGFYFLSPELTLPLGKNLQKKIGTASYFSPVPQKITQEESPSADMIYQTLPDGATPIIRCDLSSNSFFINTTKYTIDVEKARNADFPSEVDCTSKDPLVLVLHTHGTEGYFEDNTNLSEFATQNIESYFLEEETSFRTTDPEKSVVQVGKVFSETLTSLEIPTLHCTLMHDKDDFNAAYQNSAETVKAYLKQYPSIQYVIDLHRDSVVRGDSYVKSYTQIDGVSSAQVMLVVGTNQNGKHPNWEQNLIVATAFKDRMDLLFPTLSRSLYLRSSRFNQEFLPGCMLLEVGSAANSLQEAENAARFAAQAFSSMLEEEQ